VGPREAPVSSLACYVSTRRTKLSKRKICEFSKYEVSSFDNILDIERNFFIKKIYLIYAKKIEMSSISILNVEYAQNVKKSSLSKQG
jgi:hypothetical protein